MTHDDLIPNYKIQPAAAGNGVCLLLTTRSLDFTKENCQTIISRAPTPNNGTGKPLWPLRWEHFYILCPEANGRCKRQFVASIRVLLRYISTSESFLKKKRKNKKIKVTYRFEFILSPVEFCEEGPIVFGLVYHHLLQTCRQFLQISEDILHGRYHL